MGTPFLPWPEIPDEGKSAHDRGAAMIAFNGQFA